MGRINEILNELKPLNEERLFLEVKNRMNEVSLLKSLDAEIQQSLIADRVRLQELYNRISPLQRELRSLQTKYLVEYEGELTDVYNDNAKYWKSYREELYFKNDCDVNTFEIPLRTIDDLPNLRLLLTEVCDFILYHRFTNYKIINIKKI